MPNALQYPKKYFLLLAFSGALQTSAQKKEVPATGDDRKLTSSARELVTGGKSGMHTIILAATNTDSLLTVLNGWKKIINILSVDTPSHAVVIQCKASELKKLLALPQVIFMDVRATPHTETGIIGYDRSFHGINAVDYSIPGANGKNITAGVKEQKMEAADLDLYKRVLPSSLAAPSTENHATVIASIIGGAGNSFYDGRGIASGCTFFSSSFNNLFPDDAAILNANKVTVQNHSYGTVVQQFYGAEAVSYDAHTWTNKSIVHVFSAGNRGTAAASEGRYANLAGYANLTGNFKMAKNIITVGAIDNKGNIPAESSAGPLYDGRIAPQLVALGPNGTSDAAAIVSGTVAVMQQVYADSNSQAIPPASFIKAILYNSADDIYTKGIDYKTGYGLLNSYEAIRTIQQKRYDAATLAQGQSWIKNITVPANAAQLKITLAWTDTTAVVNNNKALINDLDLEVQDMNNGTVYKPWVLSTAAHKDSLVKEPQRKRDSLNTAEQVSINLPSAGNYHVKVTGTVVSTASLPLYTVYTLDTLHTFHFTSPQHASDINRQENPELTIRWKTFVADTNQTGNLYISYNQGGSWQLIKASHKIYTNQYRWPIKDTASVATLKMQTGFGDFFSSHFIISKVISPQVDFVCTDSFRLSWNRHIYANSYKLYALVDSPYLKPLLNVTDTFVVLNRTVYPSLVYAVEPVLSNSLPAARSVAFNIQQQGVSCFYKTLNYVLLDQARLNMILELSVSGYADSVYFERVTASGQLLQTYGGAHVVNNNLIYTQQVNDLPSGLIYLRGRIKLKTGAVVYTDIIPVLTPGKQKIVFYPNPARRNSGVNYVLQQGIPADSRLQVFDIFGRLVKSFASLPQSIDISTLPAGVYIFKLLDAGSNILQAGKLVIQ